MKPKKVTFIILIVGLLLLIGIISMIIFYPPYQQWKIYSVKGWIYETDMECYAYHKVIKSNDEYEKQLKDYPNVRSLLQEEVNESFFENNSLIVMQIADNFNIKKIQQQEEKLILKGTIVDHKWEQPTNKITCFIPVHNKQITDVIIEENNLMLKLLVILYPVLFLLFLSCMTVLAIIKYRRNQKRIEQEIKELKEQTKAKNKNKKRLLLEITITVFLAYLMCLIREALFSF